MIASANRGSQRARLSILRRPREDSGQVFAILVVAIVALLSMTAFVIDVGHAFYAQRSLQSIAKAQEYSGSAGGKNELGNLPNVTTSASTKCLSIVRCEPVNAVTVEATATVSTLFAKIVGVDSFEIHATATACSPCSSSPADIMLVLDRTGSMCQDSNGDDDPACTDLNNAKEGMRTFLSYLDPEAQWVGLAAFPPGPTCDPPQSRNYNNSGLPYVLVPLSQDYKNPDESLNSSSQLVSAIDCQDGGGRTAYANALEHAQAALDSQGRPDAPDIIVFLSDGAANIGPNWYPSNSPYRIQPCHQGVWSAAAIKAGETEIYSIGYDLNALGGGANVCRDYRFNLESPSITAFQALQQISSGPDYFFNQPGPGELNSIFTAIAEKVSGVRLIDESVV